MAESAIGELVRLLNQALAGLTPPWLDKPWSIDFKERRDG